jgi:hypothetical protein
MALQFTKLFAPQQLGNSNGTIYTMPATPNTLLLRNGRVRLTNTDSAAHAVTLNAVPNGGSASATNQILPAVSIPPNGYLDVDIPQLAFNDSIQGFADTANKVSIAAMDGVLQS